MNISVLVLNALVLLLVVTTKGDEVNIDSISCDSSCPDCVSLNKYYTEVGGVETAGFINFDQSSAVKLEVLFPRELPADNELVLNIGADVQVFGLNLDIPDTQLILSDICNDKIAEPLDNQACGEPGTYMLTYDFTSGNPTSMFVSGLKLQGPAIVLNNYGEVLAECSFSVSLK